MAARPRTETDSLLSRMGKERFVLGFVSDHLRGLPHAAKSAATELATSLERVNASSAEVGEALEQSLTRLQQFHENCEVLGSSSESAFKKLEEVSESLQKALAETTELIRGVRGYRKRDDKTVSRTEALEQTTHAVRDEVARLVDLAEQINLLALNSVIEAEHSGREGRPFALMAQEIRSIASKAVDEAQRVQQAVERIESEVLDATGRVGRNEQRYQEGAAKAGELTPALSGLEKNLAALRGGRDDFRRQYRGLNEHLQDIRTRYEQMNAVAERVQLTVESVASAMREEQNALEDLSGSLDHVLLAAETNRALKSGPQAPSPALPGKPGSLSTASVEIAVGRPSADESGGASGPSEDAGRAVGAVQGYLAKAARELSTVFTNERELSGGLDNAERLASDQASSASLAHRKSERLEVVAATLAERSGFIKSRGLELLTVWEERVLARVLELTGHISDTAAETHEAVEAIGALEGRVRSIDHIATTIGRHTVKIDLLALSGSLEAIKAGLEGGGFGAVAVQVRQLAQESGEVADRIRDSAYELQSDITVLRRGLDEAEGVARSENQRSSRVRETLIALKDVLRDVGSELDSLHQLSQADAAQASSLLEYAGMLSRSSEAATGSIQEASRAIGRASSNLAGVARGVERVSARMETLG